LVSALTGIALFLYDPVHAGLRAYWKMPKLIAIALTNAALFRGGVDRFRSSHDGGVQNGAPSWPDCHINLDKRVAIARSVLLHIDSSP
jgi:hypothetical protein